VRDLAGALGGEEQAQEVVGVLAAALGEEPLEVGVDLGGRLLARRRDAAGRVVAVDHRVGEAPQRVLVAVGHAQEPRDHRHREEAGEVADQLRRAAGREAVDQRSAALPDRPLQHGDPARREGPADGRAHTRVVRRVHAEQHRKGEVVDVLEEEAAARAVRFGVVQRGAHVGVPRECVEAVRLVAVRRRLVAESPVDRVRILVDLVREGIVADGGVAHARDLAKRTATGNGSPRLPTRYRSMTCRQRFASTRHYG
jgi:hypothetical protein